MEVQPEAISIHALREEGDGSRVSGGKMGKNFYPRPPRGGRPKRRKHGTGLDKFLSTPSARRATKERHPMTALDKFLSTPSARRATSKQRAKSGARSISIHALREEGDPSPDSPRPTLTRFLSTPSARRATQITPPTRTASQFLSTPSARRATRRSAAHEEGRKISIHALREEGDTGLWC